MTEKKYQKMLDEYVFKEEPAPEPCPKCGHVKTAVGKSDVAQYWVSNGDNSIPPPPNAPRHALGFSITPRR